MTDDSDHTLAWMHRLGATLNHMSEVTEDHIGRLHRGEGRPTSLAASVPVIETLDNDVARIDQGLDEYGRCLARVEDATALAEPPA